MKEISNSSSLARAPENKQQIVASLIGKLSKSFDGSLSILNAAIVATGGDRLAWEKHSQSAFTHCLNFVRESQSLKNPMEAYGRLSKLNRMCQKLNYVNKPLIGLMLQRSRKLYRDISTDLMEAGHLNESMECARMELGPNPDGVTYCALLSRSMDMAERLVQKKDFHGLDFWMKAQQDLFVPGPVRLKEYAQPLMDFADALAENGQARGAHAIYNNLFKNLLSDEREQRSTVLSRVEKQMENFEENGLYSSVSLWKERLAEAQPNHSEKAAALRQDAQGADELAGYCGALGSTKTLDGETYGALETVIEGLDKGDNSRVVRFPRS